MQSGAVQSGEGKREKTEKREEVGGEKEGGYGDRGREENWR